MTEEEAAVIGKALAEEDTVDEFIPVAAPASIYLVNGKEFIVSDVQAWGYTANGIFAEGHFKGYSGNTHILATLERIDYIELDYPALRKFLEEQNDQASSSA